MRYRFELSRNKEWYDDTNTSLCYWIVLCADEIEYRIGWKPKSFYLEIHKNPRGVFYYDGTFVRSTGPAIPLLHGAYDEIWEHISPHTRFNVILEIIEP